MPGEWMVDPAGGTGLGSTGQPSTCQALGHFLQSNIFLGSFIQFSTAEVLF